jgi:hypothetical protein
MDHYYGTPFICQSLISIQLRFIAYPSKYGDGSSGDFTEQV